MLSPAVEHVISKASEDADFRSKLHENPSAALESVKAEGVELTDEDVATLVRAFSKAEKPNLEGGEDLEQIKSSGFTSIG